MRLRRVARAALLTVVLCTVGCGTVRIVGSPRPTPEASVTGVFSEIPGDHPTLTQTGGGTYLSWDVPPTYAGRPRVVLARIDARTGAVAATNIFSPGFVAAPLYADGSLWVTDSTSLGEMLLRLDPDTLMVTGEMDISAGRYRDGAHVAYAGGWLWVDGADRLLRISPSTVAATRVIHLRDAYRSNVGASPDGSILVVSEQGRTRAVQRRNPRTGGLLASHPIGGAEAAVIDGISGSGVWITEITGRTAYAERLSVATMAPRATHPIAAPRDLNVRVADGLLWVTEAESGGPAMNYCADASTGRSLAPLPLSSVNRGSLLAVGAGVLYYAEPAPRGAGARVVPVPIPASCG